jgi:hypothetical protein
MNILDYISSSINVILDRSGDYIRYVLHAENKENCNSEQKKNNCRVFKPLSYMSQLGWFYGEPTHIIDNIYLGSAINASHYKTLKDRNIGLVINMTHELSNYYPDNIEYYNLPLYDDNSQSIKKYLNDSYEKITQFQENNPESNIFIHCFMGASRSASVVAYYLMKKYSYTKDEALLYCKNKRDVVNPTVLFYDELE